MKSTCAVVIVLPFLITFFASKSNPQVVSQSLPRLRIAAAEPDGKSTSQVAVQTIAKGSRSGVREPSRIVIHNESNWQRLWHQHTSISTAPAPIPIVDFDKEVVAAVFLGEKRTGGYNVEISSAEIVDSSLIVFVKETSPNPGAIVTQAINQPFHIVRIEEAGVETVSFRRTP